ncbi:g7377 [Coccomyxa viridis]|uniref:G7377 protein n=1 Tax=Coccomyxa viridis TaxID=1274662 RepID=A0ABP1FXR7_9CHLO
MPSGYPIVTSDQLRATAELLRLPEHATASALYFMHRFKRDCREADMPDDRLNAACLFVAAKVEETPVRTNDLLNALHYILQPRNGPELCEAFPGLLLSMRVTAEQQRDGDPAPIDAAHPTEAPANFPETDEKSASRAEMGFLAGDDYYMAKEQLITDEQILLRILCFQMNVESPQKYLLNVCRLLQCSQPLIQLAVCLVNDSQAEMQLCLQYSPLEVAAGCLHFATTILGTAQHLPHSKGDGWWRAIGVELRNCSISTGNDAATGGISRENRRSVKGEQEGYHMLRYMGFTDAAMT